MEPEIHYGELVEITNAPAPVGGKKLSAAQVTEIGIRLEAGESQSSLARAFNVSRRTIGRATLIPA
jgi:Helix-turn-helix domain